MTTQLDPLRALETDLRIALSHLWENRERLATQELHQETVLESIDDGIAITDPKDTIVYANRHFNRFFHPTDTAWLNRHIIEFQQHIKSYEEVRNMEELSHIFSKVVGSANSHHASCEIRVRKQKVHTYRIFTGPILNRERSYLGRVWKFEDITSERELDELKTEFVSLASHQLRSPITAIYGYLRMLHGGSYGEVPENIQKPLQSLLHSATQMRELVNDLLDVSRLDMGKITPEMQNLDLVELVQAEIDIQTITAQQRQVQISFQPHDTSITVYSDPKIVREMFKNYLSNGIKYSHDYGRVWVTIDSIGRDYRIAIRDEGIGIPVDQQKRLFEKFFRANNALSSGVEGTGLGLYYVKKCADILRTNVGFRSHEGDGSEFWFTLPQLETKS